MNAIYDLPTWLLGILVVGLSAALSALGLAVVQRRVTTDRRRPQNDVAGYISNIAAFVYAVLLAFLAVAVWQDYEDARTTVVLEAGAASDVFRQAEGYPEAFRLRVREAVRRYLDLVITDEWPTQGRGGVSVVAREAVEALHGELLRFEPAGERERLVHTEQLRTMRALLDQRRSRIEAAGSALHPVVWVVMVAGSVLIVAFCFFMGTSSRRAHLAMTAILGASIGLVFFLILSLDLPFRGVGIAPDPFVYVRDITADRHR